VFGARGPKGEHKHQAEKDADHASQRVGHAASSMIF
jgi:hypothetical protein